MEKGSSSQNKEVVGQGLTPLEMEPVRSELTPLRPTARSSWRNLLAYWMLGLCNNYGYVVMLSAAHDILATNFHEDTSEPVHNSSDSTNTTRSCNPVSTGAILLADIIPSLVVKILAPFLMFNIHWHIAVVVICAEAGFLLVATSTAEWMAVLGVVITALGSGLGEVSFLSYSSFFDKNVVSTWSSGTGGAGIFGASSYLGLRLVLSARSSLLVMQIVPVVMAISFWFILQHPEGFRFCSRHRSLAVNDDCVTSINTEVKTSAVPPLSLMERLKCIPALLKFMIPLGLVYLLEYFINQGLFELVDFRGIWLTHDEQYRWLQMVYQIGVFCSRSSVNFITIRWIWLLAVLQLVNVAVFTSEVLLFFIPNIWIIFAIVLWEGLLGGAAYVNTFYRISTEVPQEKREFSMGITSLADALGICIAGFVSIPVHNAICKLPRPA